MLVTANSVRELERSLGPLRQAASVAGAGLLFVDFGSTDGTHEYAIEHAPEARGVWLERDDRFAAALEVAAAASTADVVVVVDPSLRPADRRGIVRLLDHLARHQGAAAVAPLPEGLFAIRRADLAELIHHPEHELRTQADFVRELLLQGRRIDALTGDDWQDLLVGARADSKPRVVSGEPARPVVLHVAESFATGVQRHLLDLIQHLEDFEHVLAIPSHHQGRSTADAAALAEEAGARVERVEMGRSKDPRTHAVALIALRRLVGRLRPDIVHGHSSIGGAIARAATVGTSVPVVYTPNAVSRARWAVAAERLLRARTDRVIAVSKSEGEYLVDHRLAGDHQVVIIPNGIELTPPPPLAEPLRSRLGIGAEVPLFGCAGRLAWQKAPEVFVSACAILSDRLPEAHFVLIGSGPLRAQVDMMVAEADLGDRFHLIDSLPNASAAFGELDAYVLPSRYEGGPYTPLEAMRAGTPVVVTNAPGNRDVVQHWVSGLVVPQDEPHALASAMITIVRNPELGQKLVDGARRLLDRFEVRRMAAATGAVYQELRAKRADAIPLAA